MNEPTVRTTRILASIFFAALGAGIAVMFLDAKAGDLPTSKLMGMWALFPPVGAALIYWTMATWKSRDDHHLDAEGIINLIGSQSPNDHHDGRKES